MTIKDRIKEMKDKYSIKSVLSPKEYDIAKVRYTNADVTPVKTIEDITLDEGQSYKKNPFLKSENVNIDWTKDMIEEYKRCKNDPVYFIGAYGKVVHVDFGLVPFNLRPFQKDVISICTEFNRVILNTSRQVGKCIHKDTQVQIITPRNGIVNKTLFNFLMSVKTWMVSKS